MASTTMRSGPPGIYFRVTAQTAKKTLIWNVNADSSESFNSLIVVDNPNTAVARIHVPTTPAPQVATIPDAIFDVVTGYDQTFPSILGPQDLVTKVTQALRRAESWRWSKTLANIKRIEVATTLSKTYIILANLGPFQAGAVAPPPDLVIGGEPGIVFLDEQFVRAYSEVAPISWNLAVRLIHESLHHAFYSVGYTVDINWYRSLAINAVATIKFLTFTQADHHFGTTLASVVNAATLEFPMNVEGHWQKPGYDVILPSNLPGDPHIEPDLRAKSVVDTTQPPHQNFGTRLDSMETVIGLWGIGGWIDQFCPPLNYTTSGVSPASGQLVLDLSQTDGSLAWQIAGQAVLRTVDKWAEYKKINNNPNIKSTATSMGMIALMAKLGLIPKT